MSNGFMEKDEINVSSRLKDERNRLNLLQQDVADLCEVTKKTIGRWEAAAPIPSDKLILLSNSGFDVPYILFGVRSKLNNQEEHGIDNGKDLKTGSYKNMDQQNQTSIEDPSSASKHGSTSVISEAIKQATEEATDIKEPKIKDYSCGSGGFLHINFDDEFARIPLFDVKASAGNGYVIHHEEETDALIFKREWIYNELHSTPANLYLIYVEGESMEPSLRPGDVILVDHTDNVAKRDGIYVIRMGDSLLVKRLQRLPNRVLKVNSDNPDYESFEISLDVDHGTEFMIIGRVVWSGRRH